MTYDNGVNSQHVEGDGTSALDTSKYNPRKMTSDERTSVIKAGAQFTRKSDEPWLLISGRFDSGGEHSTEDYVKNSLYAAFGYPAERDPYLTINVVLDSPGGSLDSAYTTALYLSAYAGKIDLYVPDRAKSASTLLALAANTVYLSPFGQLGPLDTQIPDPRNPTVSVSALDCYQSVDYVRTFGAMTIQTVFNALLHETNRRLLAIDLLQKACSFAENAVSPMLSQVTALDFGGWGRSLRIGEHYGRKLLEARGVPPEEAEHIANTLVFKYTHHFFPIDLREATDIGLDNVEPMEKEVYDGTLEIVRLCNNKDFVGFISPEESDKEKRGSLARRNRDGLRSARDETFSDRYELSDRYEHAQAEVHVGEY
ncbi:SDH family Clp fold serine proteinase [Catenulispora subtropica]|uniref:Uncharacterized protein n=1 Tax=Catenulispora subtropica TaxID=450798 RepID=A0ABP5DQS7_9ACTN